MRILLVKHCSAAFAAFFLGLGAVTPVSAAEPGVPGAETAGFVTSYERLVAMTPVERGALKGELQRFEIDLSASPGFSLDVVDGRQEVRYRMAFNNIAEGWSWRPLADPQQEDYYRTKFLPLGSVLVERGEYDSQDKIGETQHMKVTWRYDYFLAFDNLYDFYPRTVDDDAGFVLRLPAGHPLTADDVRMVATIRLGEPFISESTTFWKAIHSRPVDFTLKKRYVLGELEEVTFSDRGSGVVLGRLVRK